MNDDELRLRRDLRAAIFRAARLHRAGRELEADEQLAGELAAVQARLAARGDEDAAATVRRWQGEAEAAFDLALLVAELVAPQPTAPPPAAPDTAPTFPRPAAVPTLAFPPPPAGVPGLADLLDDMLAQDRHSRPRPP